MKIAILGASGYVGQRVIRRALDRGWGVTGHTRKPEHLAPFGHDIRVVTGNPASPEVIDALLAGQDAVVFALGTDRLGATTLFSDVTRALLPAMTAAGVRRLVAVTGVGAGETRGHGGFVYDRLIFPLVTRPRYLDKDRQEALITASDLDWTIIRPAPFGLSEKRVPFQIVTNIAPDTKLTRIEPDEVADFIVSCLAERSYLREKPFIGHLK